MYEVWSAYPYEGEGMCEKFENLEDACAYARKRQDEYGKYGHQYFVRQITEYDF